MVQTQRSSRRTLLIGIGAVIGLILVITLITLALFGSTRRDNSATNTSSESQVATQDEVAKDLDNLDDAVKQISADQAATKAALNDDEKRVKVGGE